MIPNVESSSRSTGWRRSSQSATSMCEEVGAELLEPARRRPHRRRAGPRARGPSPRTAATASPTATSPSANSSGSLGSASAGERVDGLEDRRPRAADRRRLLPRTARSPSRRRSAARASSCGGSRILGDAPERKHERGELARGERRRRPGCSLAPPRRRRRRRRRSVRPAACRVMIQSSRNDVGNGGGPSPSIGGGWSTGNE